MLRNDFDGVRIGIEGVSSRVQEVSGSVGAMRDDLDRKSHGEFLEWVGYYDTTYILNRANGDRLAGTGAWIYDDGNNSTVKKWLSSQPNDHQILWMTADPGFGKTCLTARIVKELGEFDPRGIASFFCSAYDNNTHSVLAILQSWVHQLLRTRIGEAHFTPPYYYEGFINKEPPTVPSLCDLVRELFLQDKPTRLIVDGLDECRVDKKVAEEDFETFFELLAEIPENWRVLLVSRNNPYFQPSLKLKLGEVVKTKEILPKDTKDDLASFVQDQMQEYGQRKGWGT